jgi:DNA polymerase III subunit epsilon
MPWSELSMAGIDLETTGTDPEHAQIVTACVGLQTGQSWTAHTWLFRQSAPIPADAVAIHGITTEYANTHGEDPATALAELRDALYQHWSQGHPVVAFNAPYDLTVLDRNLRRAGLGDLDVAGPVLDPRVIDKEVDKYRKGRRQLGDVCAHYGISLTASEAHGADADARAACSLARKLGASLPPRTSIPLGARPLEDIHAWQANAYRASMLEFADYRRRKGQPLDDANSEWPLREFAGAAR